VTARRGALLAAGLAAACSSLLGAHAARAAGFPDVESEVPLPSLIGNEARPLGMGGAGIAVSEDGSATYWNPAGLAQMRRIEVSTSLTHDRGTISNTWEGFDSSARDRSTNLGSVHVVYPFPTYRGSFVIALGTDQLRNFDMEYERRTVEGPSDAEIEKHDTISESGKLTAWTVALAMEASPRLYLGIAGSIHDGESHRAENQLTTDVDNVVPDTARFDDLFETDAEISGFSGTFGLLYRVNPNWRVGATIRSGIKTTFEGSQVSDFLTIFDDGGDENDVSEILFEDEIDFPLSFGLGAAFSAGNLTVAADARYTDWSEIQISDSPFLNRDFRKRYNETGSVYLGGEYLIGASPVRVRAGFLYDPVPFRLAYKTDDGSTLLREVMIDRERALATFGAGLLLDTVFTLDVAVQTGSFTRESAVYSEERELTRIVASGAYRF
jgi:long-subunit fatty acid transport protein